jgi:hypothetical protein
MLMASPIACFVASESKSDSDTGLVLFFGGLVVFVAGRLMQD